MSILDGSFHVELERRPGLARMVDLDSGRAMTVRECEGDLIVMDIRTPEGQCFSGSVHDSARCIAWIAGNVELSGALMEARKTDHPWAWVLGQLFSKLLEDGQQSAIFTMENLPGYIQKYFGECVQKGNFIVADVPFMPHCPKCGEKLTFGKFGASFGDQFRCESCQLMVGVKDYAGDGSFSSMVVACDPLSHLWPTVFAMGSGGRVN